MAGAAGLAAEDDGHAAVDGPGVARGGRVDDPDPAVDVADVEPALDPADLDVAVGDRGDDQARLRRDLERESVIDPVAGVAPHMDVPGAAFSVVLAEGPVDVDLDGVALPADVQRDLFLGLPGPGLVAGVNDLPGLEDDLGAGVALDRDGAEDVVHGDLAGLRGIGELQGLANVLGLEGLPVALVIPSALGRPGGRGQDGQARDGGEDQGVFSHRGLRA